MSSGSASRSPSPSSDNDVFAISTKLVPVREPKAAGTATITFDSLLTNPPLLLHEDLQSGCGGQLWPAGMLLSKYILTHLQQSLHDKSIIEIGAGGGLVGLAVAIGCNANNPIAITDQDVMYDLMKKNIALNKLECRVMAEIYDWGSPPPETLTAHWQMSDNPNQQGQCFPDVVLAADCVYFEPAFPLLLQTLGDLIGPNTTCYFCFKKRRKADMRFIKDMLKKFEVDEVEWEGREQGRRDGIWLYKVRCRSRA